MQLQLLILLDQTSTVAQSETVLPTVISERSSDSVSDVTANQCY